MKTLPLILGTLTLAGASLLSGCGNDDEKYSLQGELVEDYVQNEGNGWNFYRIFVKTDSGIVTYPIIGDSLELVNLERQFKSREEAILEGINRGDMIGINPKSNIFSLQETILTPDDIKKLEGGQR